MERLALKSDSRFVCTNIIFADCTLYNVHGLVDIKYLFSFVLNKFLLSPENITQKETKLVLFFTLVTHLPQTVAKKVKTSLEFILYVMLYCIN